MEETTIEVPSHYNANQLVTYKVIKDGVASFPTTKVNDLEWELEQYRRTQDRVNELQSTINKIIDNMSEEYWFNPNTEKETILEDLCEILKFNPVKTVEFSAVINVNGAIEIPLNEAEDFDLESFLSDTISVDSYGVMLIFMIGILIMHMKTSF